MKKAYFFIDDVIWVMRDLTKKRPQTLFENPFMKMLKENHDRYGLKVQLNLFYRTDSYYGYNEFTLADMTDAYKKEFEANSDWLKFAFHALEEFPDYPHINIDYEDTVWLFKNIEKEVFRFAGKDSFSYAVCPHWVVVSKDGVRALRDCGTKLVHSTYGDAAKYEDARDLIPCYHDELRLLNNRKPEARVVANGRRFIPLCSFNHIPTEDNKAISGTLKTVYNEELDIHFKNYHNITLNKTPYEKIYDALTPYLDDEYIGIVDHEQYFYSDYFSYQPDYADRIERMCKCLTEGGFTFINGEEILG